MINKSTLKHKTLKHKHKKKINIRWFMNISAHSVVMSCT